MDAQVIAAVKEERGSVTPVELDEVVPADHVARVAGDGDHKVEDDVVSQEIKEVLPIDVPSQPHLDDAEERVQRAEVFDPVSHPNPLVSAHVDGFAAL